MKPNTLRAGQVEGHLYCERCDCPSGGDDCTCAQTERLIRLMDECDRRNDE